MELAYVYILFSDELKKYYIGMTSENPELRLDRHNSGYYDNKFTSRGRPWSLFHVIECDSLGQARKIEQHIKNMKSKKYIENLVVYPEISLKLKRIYA
jgi:putative endonuclease